MWLDSDRLANLNVTPENLKNQISVVEEEKRLRVDNQPYGTLLYDLGDHTFTNWQNSHSVIGSFTDLDAATLADVKAFFDAYYAPRNIILGIVGDIDPERTRELVTKYFGWIPNRGAIQPVNTAETPPAQERHFTLTDAHANVPGVVIAWQGPQRNSPDYYALSMLGELLFSGKSSRLYQSLVKQRQVAISVDGGLGFPEADFTDYKSPGLFAGFIVYKSDTDPTLIEQLVFREIHEIVANGPTADELQRVRTKMMSEWVQSEQTTLDRSQVLLTSALLDGDPATVNSELDKLLDVKAEDIQRAAAAFLTHPRTTVVVDVPGKVQPGKPPAAPSTGRRG
jgi:predicted Zn-dependent peptidase